MQQTASNMFSLAKVPFHGTNLSAALKQLRYKGFVSFEWEKQWHPELEDAAIAVPHFAKQFARGIRSWLSTKRCGPCEPRMCPRPSSCLRKQVGIRPKKTGARCSNSPGNLSSIEVDGQLAATTTLLCYGQRLAWIGMVLTRLEFQRRGFAKKLFGEALKRADEMEIETIKLDATKQGQPIYEQFGFRREEEIVRCPGRTPALSRYPSCASSPPVWRPLDATIFGATV